MRYPRLKEFILDMCVGPVLILIRVGM